jgi:Uma2 family endonuclease
MPVLPDIVGFTLAPDWLCEVLSPSTRTLDRTRRMRIYARETVSDCWLVDPLARTLQVYRLHEGSWMLADSFGGATVRAQPFTEVELDPCRWWLD